MIEDTGAASLQARGSSELCFSSDEEATILKGHNQQLAARRGIRVVFFLVPGTKVGLKRDVAAVLGEATG